MTFDAQTSDVVARYPFTEPPVHRLVRRLRPELSTSKASPVIIPEEPVISEEFRHEIREDFRRIYYHEAGHAVALHWFGFRPTGIIMKATYFDARTIRFMTGKKPSLRTCGVRDRATDYAVCVIAGIAAESRIIRKPLKSLRGTSGLGDYQRLRMIGALTSNERPFELTHRVAKAQLDLWEAKAVALIAHKPVWDAVKSVVADLRRYRGILTEEQTVSAIGRVLGPRPRHLVCIR